MPQSLKAELSARQAQDSDRSLSERSQERDQWFSHLRTAMKDTGWTEDSLAAHWKVDRSYVNRLLNDDKPWSLDRVLALPDDLEGRLEGIRAEHFGLIVVAPLRGLDAQKAFVAGLIGIMSAPALPEKSSGQVKAELTERREKKTA